MIIEDLQISKKQIKSSSSKRSQKKNNLEQSRIHHIQCREASIEAEFGLFRIRKASNVSDGTSDAPLNMPCREYVNWT
jgi:hypothetical protein